MDAQGSSHSLDFDSGASLSGMTASGSGSSHSQNSQQMDISQNGTSQNAGIPTCTSSSTIKNGFVDVYDNDPASALALDPTFGPDLPDGYEGSLAFFGYFNGLLC